MKRLLLVFSFCLMYNLTYSQSPQLDDTFNSNDIGSNEGRTIRGRPVSLPNGKILICNESGSFSSGFRYGLMRLNIDGTVDNSFTVLPFPFGSVLFSVGLQPDGKIIKYGYGFERLNEDGSQDTSFQTNIIIGDTNGNGYLINDYILQPDGKFIIGGKFISIGGVPANGIARLNSDGSLDTTFNVGGTGVLYGVDTGSSRTGVNRLLLQPDGKVVVLGNFTAYNGVAKKQLIRINSDGSLDTTFDSGTGFSISSAVYLNSLSLQPDGKMIVGGNFSAYNGSATNGLVRLNSDGSIDSGFNIGSGFKKSYNGPFGVGFTPGTVNATLLQSDGKIIVAGEYDRFNGTTLVNILRLNPDGTLDTSFKDSIGGTYYSSNTGLSGLGFISYLHEMANHKILVSGQFTSYNNTIRISSAVIAPDGKLDLSFNYVTSFDATVLCSAIQEDGKIIVGGNFSKYSGVDRKGLTRLNNDGSIDTSFDIESGPESGYVQSIAIQSDGKIIAGGYFKKFNGIAKNSLVRLNTDGSMDNGFIDIPEFNNRTVTKIILEPSGKILVATTSKLFRLNQDGTIDNTFQNLVAENITMAQRTDGKIVVYRYIHSGVTESAIRFLNNDGTFDGAFNPAYTNTSGHNVNSIQLQPDGKIIMVGDFENVNNLGISKIARLNVDGTLDVSFYVNGNLSITNIKALRILSNGKILIGGESFSSSSTTLMRLNPNGSIDTGFTSGGSNFDVVSLNNTGISYLNSTASIYDINVQSGKIYVGGSFTSYRGTPRNRFLRLIDPDALSVVDDLTTSTSLKIFPNPTADFLNIDVAEGIQINEINIYNTIGQLVFQLPNGIHKKAIDVSNLNQGTYIIKINSNQGTLNKTFLKK